MNSFKVRKLVFRSARSADCVPLEGGGEGREITEITECNFRLMSRNVYEVMQCAYDGSGEGMVGEM